MKGPLIVIWNTRDTASWKRKSWIVGVDISNVAKAYDWNELAKKRVIEDSIDRNYLLLTMMPDKKSFFVLNRNVNGQILHFSYDAASNDLTDAETHSQWLLNGSCVTGALQGKQLQPVQAYQEFWHSWQTFHRQTSTYK